jgi:hypothetical protein
MLELLMKHTYEKNNFLAEMGYKIFFSSATLTLNSKLMAGLITNRKPVAGLTTKNCQLFLGRYSMTLPFTTNRTLKTLPLKRFWNLLSLFHKKARLPGLFCYYFFC